MFKNPKFYTDHNSMQWAGIQIFYDKFSPYLESKFLSNYVTILDVGTGCGKSLVKVVQKLKNLNFSNTIGIDASSKMIDFAKNNFESSIMKFYVMDAARDIPEELKNEYFDLVTSFYCLHWIKDTKAALMNISNFLKPGGIFCCNIIPEHVLYDIWIKIMPKYQPYMKDWRSTMSPILAVEHPIEGFKQLIEDCGIEIIDFMDLKDQTFDYGTKENFLNSIKALSPWLESMPEDMKQKCNDDQCAELFNMQNGFVTKIRTFYVIGKKRQ